MQWETGKARIHAAVEVQGVVSVARHYAARGGAYLGERRALGVVPGLSRPRGVPAEGLVGVIAPWNTRCSWPSAMWSRRCSPGTRSSSKADSQGPLTLLHARHLAVRARGCPRPCGRWSQARGAGSGRP